MKAVWSITFLLAIQVAALSQAVADGASPKQYLGAILSIQAQKLHFYYTQEDISSGTNKPMSMVQVTPAEISGKSVNQIVDSIRRVLPIADVSVDEEHPDVIHIVSRSLEDSNGYSLSKPLTGISYHGDLFGLPTVLAAKLNADITGLVSGSSFRTGLGRTMTISLDGKSGTARSILTYAVDLTNPQFGQIWHAITTKTGARYHTEVVFPL